MIQETTVRAGAADLLATHVYLYRMSPVAKLGVRPSVPRALSNFAYVSYGSNAACRATINFSRWQPDMLS